MSVGGGAGSSRSAACCAVLLAAVLLFFSALATTEAHDSLDPNGNITIKWDVMQWTPDGYVVSSLLGLFFFANCCKAGVVSAFNQDQSNAASSFQIVVGLAGNSRKTVKVPKHFTLKAPGYTCGSAIVGRRSMFFSADGRRATRALMTWNVTCTYSPYLATKTPTCCVSVSSFYNDRVVVDCPTCSCGCQNNGTGPGSCVHQNPPYLQCAIDGPGEYTGQPLVQCPSHMCPIRIHWHVKLNYNEYWRVRVTITNLNYRMNYTQWNLVIQHPNFDNVTKVFSFNYKPVYPYVGGINDTAMFWGVKSCNDVLMQAGPLGNAQSELLLQKDSATFTLGKGWTFPRRVYFNGDNCVMPSPESYPQLPFL